MSALVKNIGLSSANTSVTKISAHARIDYILRFSKQAVLVIDESAEQNAALSGAFLSNLPEQHNAAYILLSGQFNHIQIRCRIIEQLSSGELFDPEISLAESVINLAKKSHQAISVVLDNAQHLSLQIVHELSQLAMVAKKANLTVNIVMFGSKQAGVTVANNPSLFEQKLTLLSAQSGQLLPTTSELFKNSASKAYFIMENKWLVGVFVFLIAIGVSVVALLQQDSFNFSQSLVAVNQEKVSLSKALAEPQTMVLLNRNKALAEVTEKNLTRTTAHQAAMPENIYLSLTEPLAKAVVITPPKPASPADIVSAMTATGIDSIFRDDAVILATTADHTDSQFPKQNSMSSKPLTVNNSYYSDKDGYVIQIAAFRGLNLPTTFLTSLSTMNYQAYQRLLDDQPMVVITSTIYAEKAAAKSAISALPKSLLARKPWIKPVVVINREINAFHHSQ